MASQKGFNLADCSTPSFRRTPEYSNIKVFPAAGVRPHDEKPLFRVFATPL
jgi:hypothetical protein